MRVHAVQRPHVDDATVTLRLHDRESRPHRPEYRIIVEREGADHIVIAVIFDTLGKTGPGIVHQDVEAAEARMGGLNHRFHLCRLRHVGLDEKGVDPVRVAQITRRFLTLVRVALGDGDPCASLSQRAGDALPDALSAARDERSAPFQ